MSPLLVSRMQKWCLMLERLSADSLALRKSPDLEIDEYVRLIGIIPQFSGVTTDLITYTTRRRAAATILAVRLYHHERGEYPATLEALAPEYLSAVPLVPGKEVGLEYVLEKGRPVLIIPPAKWPPVGKFPSGTLRGPIYFDVLPQP